MSCAEPEFEPRRYSLRTACQRPRRCGRVVVENGRQREEDLTDRKIIVFSQRIYKKIRCFPDFHTATAPRPAAQGLVRAPELTAAINEAGGARGLT